MYKKRFLNSGKTVFSQVMDILPRQCFFACVRRYNGDSRVRRLSCRGHFRVMAPVHGLKQSLYTILHVLQGLVLATIRAILGRKCRFGSKKDGFPPQDLCDFPALALAAARGVSLGVGRMFAGVFA